MKKMTGYFDFVCPYCYLGTAYAEKMQREIPCEINWTPVNIHPDLPPEGQDVFTALPHVTDMSERLSRLRKLGATIDLPFIENCWVPNTQKALEAMEYARDQGKENIFMKSVFNAYFGSGLNIADEKVVVLLAEAVGLDGSELKKAWQEKRYEARMNGYIQDAQKIEHDVVPTLVLDGKKVLEASQTMTFEEYQEKYREIFK